jgi:hypothetical protein
VVAYILSDGTNVFEKHGFSARETLVDVVGRSSAAQETHLNTAHHSGFRPDPISRRDIDPNAYPGEAPGPHIGVPVERTDGIMTVAEWLKRKQRDVDEREE